MPFLRMTLSGATLFALVVTLTACGSKPPAEPTLRTAMVVQPVAIGAAGQILSGDVRARQEPALAFRVGGKIQQRHVDAGARVQKGQLLAELDPDDLRLQAEAAAAQLAAAVAEQELAQSERERYAQMLERKLVSASVYEAKAATFEAAQAQVNTARSQLTVMENQRAYARLLAPQDGVITQRLAEAGQVVAAGQAVFVLAADGEREVAVSVPESQIANVQLGQTAMVELWTHGGEYWPGVVRELSPTADPQARTFAARVAFQASVPVELGQSARVHLATATTDALGVPLAAVGGEAGAAFVWVLDADGQRARRRPVEVLAWGERLATIGAGLSTDDWVVAGGVHLIREGERLRAVDRDNRPLSTGSQRQ